MSLYPNSLIPVSFYNWGTKRNKRQNQQIDFEMFLNKLDPDMVKKVKHKMHNSFNLIRYK